MIAGLKVGGTCTAKTDANVCTDNASCSLDSALNRYLCACSGTAQTDGTCSAPSGQYHNQPPCTGLP